MKKRNSAHRAQIAGWLKIVRERQCSTTANQVASWLFGARSYAMIKYHFSIAHDYERAKDITDRYQKLLRRRETRPAPLDTAHDGAGPMLHEYTAPHRYVRSEYIERDRAGCGGYIRYTHIPSGETLIQQPFYRTELSADRWARDRNEFLKKYENLDVFSGGLYLKAVRWIIESPPSFED
jgi:hypothetical protein